MSVAGPPKPANRSLHVILEVGFCGECGVGSIWGDLGCRWATLVSLPPRTSHRLPLYPQHPWAGRGREALVAS